MSQALSQQGRPQPINTFLESLISGVNSGQLSEAETELRAQKDEATLVLLAKLALVYWRPDFTPGQAKQLYAQYLEDLREYAFSDIAAAMKKYRQNPENKFFPTPGQIRGIIETPASWDVISKREHISNRRHVARVEMDKMLAGGAGQVLIGAR